jgi:hypothetical protein
MAGQTALERRGPHDLAADMEHAVQQHRFAGRLDDFSAMRLHRLRARNVLEEEHGAVRHLLRTAAKHAGMDIDGHVDRAALRARIASSAAVNAPT